MAWLQVVGRGETYIRVRVEGLVYPPNHYSQITFNNTTTGAGVRDYNYGGGQNADGYYTETWVSGNLQPDTLYNFSAMVYSAQEYWYYTSGRTLKATRPSNFSWTYSKYSGGNFNLTDDEWNSFYDRINAFRVYKGLSTYNYTRAYTGNPFRAVMFNQAVDGINALNPTYSTPTHKSSGNIIYASHLNQLVTALNSVQ